MSGLKDKLADFGYGAGWALVCKVPRSWAEWAFRFFADIAWRREGPRVQILEANLVRVLGPDVDGAALRAASREVMRRYARYWLEIFLLPTMPVEELVSGMRDIGHRDTIFETMASGRGVVVGIPHMGNWDQAGAWIIEQGAGSFTTVAERLKPESLYDRFVEFREGLGMEVLPASGGARPFGLLAQRLRAGKMVILPCDRDITGSGIEVEFFGEKAKMMGGPAALAVQTGAALLGATPWFNDDGWGVNISAEIKQPSDGDRGEKVAMMTQELAQFFENNIRDHPYDWLMLQKVFVADLDPERQAAAKAKAARSGFVVDEEPP
ncbi:MAG TPA: phosphatidylinositol mannoside acyltransferase [Streptosporangiaceae bacterium]|nr:phosphatidylinositol mannoside acyltransferase [Streptosporangiaceae bacterium]